MISDQKLANVLINGLGLTGLNLNRNVKVWLEGVERG